MPGPITHLKVANIFLDGSIKESSAFYLGSISPDSVNINGHAEKAKRWPAHLREKDLDAWLDRVKLFWNENKDTNKDSSFLKGYLLHIITDIVWDMHFERELFILFAAGNVAPEQRKAMRWCELYGYEKLQLKLPWFKSEVLPSLAVAKPQAIGTLDVNEVALWQQRIVSGELEQGRFPLFLDDLFMNRFFDKVCSVAKQILV